MKGTTLYFNELSLCPLAENAAGAKTRMTELLRAARPPTGFRVEIIRISEMFEQWPVASEYTLGDWLRDRTVSPTEKTFFRSRFRGPYIPDAREDLVDRYAEETYRLAEPEAQEFGIDLETMIPDGLSSAAVAASPALSANGAALWRKPVLSVRRISDDRIVQIANIAVQEHYELHEKFFDAELLETGTPTADKKISLPDHHGQEVLLRFSQKLIRSPYVVGVINSIDMNSAERRFVRRIREDGLIELRLTRTERGLGLVVQTTGRTQAETTKIAGILERNFESEY